MKDGEAFVLYKVEWEESEKKYRRRASQVQNTEIELSESRDVSAQNLNNVFYKGEDSVDDPMVKRWKRTEKFESTELESYHIYMQKLD